VTGGALARRDVAAIDHLDRLVRGHLVARPEAAEIEAEEASREQRESEERRTTSGQWTTRSRDSKPRFPSAGLIAHGPHGDRASDATLQDEIAG